jgi:hypothetical protein
MSVVVIADDRIVRMSPGEPRTVWETEVTLRRSHEDARFASHPGDYFRSYLRWDEHGSELFLVVRTLHDKAIGRVESVSGRIEWLDLQVPEFTWGKYNPISTAEQAPLAPRGGIAGTELPQEAAYSSLFGSIENPVWSPTFSTDRRFYFYVTRREGFLANGWIEGFDRKTHEAFRVRTLWWDLYAE